MDNIVNISEFRKQKTTYKNRKPLYVSHVTGKVTADVQGFDERINRIRSSLERINKLMADLKHVSEQQYGKRNHDFI